MINFVPKKILKCQNMINKKRKSLNVYKNPRFIKKIV